MFKDNLKKLRKERNITQAELAKKLGVSTATIANYETGTRQPRTKVMWNTLADFFNISVDELMNENNFTEIHYLPTNISDKKQFLNAVCQTRENADIIFEGINISDFVYNRKTEINDVKPEFASIAFQVQSGHAKYARFRFLEILYKIQELSANEIKDNLHHIKKMLVDDVFYWYTRIWYNLNFEEFFPNDVNNLAELYDLIMICRNIDDVATRDYYLVELKLDYEWLRDKLRDV